MRKPEQLLFEAMKRARQKSARDFWLQRVENAVGSGMPDVFVTCENASAAGVFWVELKVADEPKKPETPVFQKMSDAKKNSIRQSQINWHLKYHSMGGSSFILAKIGLHLYLFEGCHADRLTGIPLTQLNTFARPEMSFASMFTYWKEEMR